MTESQWYAYIEVSEYGEPDRERRIGPFYAESADDLRDVLEREGDQVNYIEAA